MPTEPITNVLENPASLLSRRRLITLGLTAAGMVILPGCGGSGGGHKGGGSSASFVTVPGTIVLPTGLAATGLTFVSGGGEGGVTGSVRARVLAGSPTLVSVLEGATGRIVMVGMVDPNAAHFTFDAANVAAALIFLGRGGTQETTEGRQELWNTIVAGGPTATLAGVVTTRLAADPFALENGDTVLVAAIADAIAGFGDRSPDRAAKGRSVSRPSVSARGASVSRPTPAVYLALDDSRSSLVHGAVGHGQVGTDTVPDLLSITNLNALDSAFYAYHTVFSGGTIQSVSRLVGPVTVPASRPSLTEFGPIPVGLETATDSIELMSFVGLTAIFDAPEAPALSDPAYAGEADGWRAQLRDLWQRAVVQMAADIAYDALGWRQSELSTEALITVVANLRAIGGTQLAVNQAAQGTQFGANVDLLTDFASHDVLSASTFLDAIRPLAPVTDTPSAFRLAQMRGLLRISRIDGLLTASRIYGRIYGQSVYNSSNEVGPTVQVLDGHSIKRLILNVHPATPTYTPGGPDIVFTVDDGGIHYLEPYENKIVYRWKVFGSGTLKITDGQKINTEFESAHRTVTLTTGSDATGVISVSAEAISTAGGKTFSLGKGTGSVNGGTNTHFALTPVDSHILIGGTGGWTVTYNGSPTMSGWGVDHLRFRWEIASTDHGKLGVSSPTGAVVETTTNGVQYFPNLDAQDGNETALTCTVAQVDPSTGDFTNLAVLTGKAIADVRSSMQFHILNASFPLSDLRFPDVFRMLVSTSATLNGSDESGPYVGVTYARPGGSTVDFVGLVFRSSSNFAEATQLTIDSARSGITLAGALGVQPFNASIVSGTAAVFEAVRNGAGQLTFLKVTGTINFAESGGLMRAMTVDFTGGIGIPPY